MDIEFMDDDDFLTVKEVAEILGYTESGVKHLIRDGKLRSNRGNAQPGRIGFSNKMHLIPVSEVRRLQSEGY